MGSKLRKFSESGLIFLGLVVLALALRSIYFSQTAKYIQPATGSDGYFYLQWAEDIVRGNVAGKVFYALPVYPYFLALVYLFCGGDIFGIVLAQIFIGAVNCGLIYVLGKSFFNNQAGVIASIIACGYFMLIFYDRMLLPATLAIFLGLLFALLLLKIRGNPSSVKWFGAGLLLGLSVLARASFFLLGAFILFWIFYEYKKKAVRQRLLYCLFFILAFSLIIGGVSLRNYLVAKDAVLITAHSGINFYIGNNPGANGIYKVPPYMRNTQSGMIEDAHLFAERISKRQLKASEASNFWFKEALGFIRSQPLNYLRLLGKKFVLFCNGKEFVDEIGYSIYNEEAQFSKLPLFSFAFVCPLAILGMFFSWAGRRKTALLYFFVISFMVATVSFFINSRYRLVVVPFLIIFAGEAVWQLFQSCKNRQYKNFIFSLLVFFALYFLCNVKLVEASARKDDYIFHYNKGVISSDSGDYQKAEKEFQTALKLNPRDFLSFLGLGNVYYQLRDFEQAIDNYRKASAVNPYFYTAHFNLGIIYDEMGREKEAEEEFEKVLELKGRHCAAHYNLGRIYQEKGLRSLALKQYNQALEVKPGHRGILQAIKEIKQDNLK